MNFLDVFKNTAQLKAKPIDILVFGSSQKIFI